MFKFALDWLYHHESRLNPNKSTLQTDIKNH